MPELVRRGHIYIAQPPLYQIKRKKREEYVEDDSRLNRILISLGAEEVRLRNLKDNREFSEEQLNEILELLERLSKLSDSIRKHGGDFEEYIAQRHTETGALPEYLVSIRDGNQEYVNYFPDETALKQFADENQDLQLYDEPLSEDGELPLFGSSNGQTPPHLRRRARRVELHEANAVLKVFQELSRRGLEVAHYATNEEPLFELIDGEGERATSIPVSSIPKILETVKEIGRRGVQIKRFKGLGEMNAKELFSTTMDPAKRKLLQVELNENNAVEADKMFTILMGDVVEPRRAFIEDNALNVRNLDI
jgi:DNA gyrase subunit B